MRNWTPEGRAKQAAACRRHQPWKNSTGPRTDAGKERSSRNSYKHGSKSAEILELRRVLRLHRTSLRALVKNLPFPFPPPPPKNAERTDKTPP